MTDDLIYVEMVHRARSSGNLSPDSWETSILTAFSWAGRDNPLGASLVDWLDGFRNGPACITKFLLSGHLERSKACRPQDSVDIAEYGMSWFKDQNCDKCEGRGVIDQSQTQCPFCAGTGKKPQPSGPVYRCVKEIEATLQTMNGALRFRMRGHPHPPSERVYRIAEPASGMESNGLRAVIRMAEGF